MSKKRTCVIDQRKAEAKCGTAIGLWLSTKDAAKYLGLCDGTLRNARNKGLLAGVTPPPYRKFGRVCRYHSEDLDAWLTQFEPQTSTSATA